MRKSSPAKSLPPELEARQKEIDEQIIKENPLYFHEMNRAQRRFVRIKNESGKTPKRRLFEAGNKVGKTEEGIIEDIAHAMGFRPWLKETDPDYKIDVKVPNDGLIGCETMMHSVPEKIEPTLKRLIPKVCKPVFKPGPTGVIIRVTLPYDAYGKKCGSVIHIRSYDQQPDTFEGIDSAWIHWDEPPPEKVFKAAERGKIVTNSPSWFTMTPLKEPYIYDKFSLKAFTHGGEDQEIAVIRAPIWDNCRDYCRPCNLIIPENAEERTIKRCPKCNQVMGFIPKAGIDQYLSTLDADEREAREEGKWHHLSGLVYKEIDREKHVYDDFTIPKNWMKIESVDPHDARPVHWLFGAVSPEEIEIEGKKRNRIYWYDYLLAKGDVDEIVRQVKAKRALHGYEVPYFVVLDKKFGEKTQMEEKSWQTELERRGISRIRLSHSSPGDVELGHKITREYLKPQFSQLIGTAKPGMLWAKRACTGKDSPFHAMCNYQYKENKDKPEEEYKDWCDCTRYAAMEQPVYKAPENEKKVFDLLSKRNSDSMKQRRMGFARA
jgi:phage terminase large subunit-like protein